MSRSVLLVEPDLDALGAVASKLRSRGLTVALADSAEGVLDRVHSLRPDAVLLSAMLPESSSIAAQVHADPALGTVKCFILVNVEPSGELPAGSLVRSDVDSMVKRLYALPSKPPPSAAIRDDFRGDLRKLSVPDLLQLLSMNRRTGSLSVTVASGAGEVRLINGEVVDAVFRRLEAEKALYRLLGESDGTFAFTSGLPAPVRRIGTPTNVLLLEGMRRMDEVRQRRGALAAEGEALSVTSRPDEHAPGVVKRVMAALLAPHTIDELLDEIPDADHEILEVLEELLRQETVRRIPKGAVRVELADPEQMTVMGALANRLRARGYAGPARLVLATSARTLATLTRSIRRISGAVPAADAAPSLPLPHHLATMRLGEGAELDIVGLPTAEAYSPVWGLALGGCAAAVRLGVSASPVLEEACAVAGVPLLDAEALLGEVDAADPAQVAALVRATLDATAGG